MSVSYEKRAVRLDRRLVLVLAVALVGAAAGIGVSRVLGHNSRFTGSEFVMDTLVTVTVYGPRAAKNGRAALAEFQRLDELLSAFREASDVGRVNAAAGREAVRVSRETLDLVAESLRLAALSGGRFDPTIGPLVKLWGVGDGRTTPPSPADVAKARQLVDYRRVMVDREGSRLYLPLPGMALDLGGVAKGYAAEQAERLLRRRGVKSALIDAGGNIVAIGTRLDGRPWRVGVRHPRKADEVLGVLSVADRTVVTSGDYERYFTYQGRRYHHILDPRTGYPAEGLESATIVAGSSTLADLLSTSVFVLGPALGPEFAQRNGAAAIVVDGEGRISVAPGLKNAWQPASASPAKGVGQS